MKLGLNAKLAIGILASFGLLIGGYYCYGPMWWKWQEKRLASADSVTRTAAAETVAKEGGEAVTRAARWMESEDDNLAIGALEVLGKVENFKINEFLPQLLIILKGKNSPKTDAAAKLVFAKCEFLPFDTICGYLSPDDLINVTQETKDACRSPRFRFNMLAYAICNSSGADEEFMVFNSAFGGFAYIPLLEANDFLVEILKKDPSNAKRAQAALALAEREDPDSVPHLISAMRGDHDIWVRETSANALEKFLDVDGVFEALNSALLNEKEPAVLEKIIKTLGFTVDEKLIEPMASFLNHYDSSVRAAALDTLYQIFSQDPYISGGYYRQYNYGSSDMRKKAEEIFEKHGTLKTIRSMISGPNSANREGALWLLYIMGDNSSFDDVFQILSGNDYDKVYEAAVGAISKYKDERAIPPLVKFILESRKEVEWTKFAAEAIHNIGTNKSDKALIDAYLALRERGGASDLISKLQESIRWSRNSETENYILELAEQGKETDLLSVAGGFMAATRNPETVRRLHEIYRKAQNTETSLAVCRIFRELIESKHAPVLAEIFEKADKNVRAAVAEYFKKFRIFEMCAPLCSALLKSGSVWEKIAIVECLGGIGCASVVDFLDNEFDSTEDFIYKNKVLKALGEIADPRSRDLFFKIASGKDNDWQMRFIAMGYIGRFDRAEAVKLLKTLPEDENDTNLLRGEICAMDGMPDNSFYPALKKIVDSELPGDICDLAAEAMRKLDCPGKDEDFARMLLTHDRPNVRLMAVEELGKLGGNVSFTALSAFISAHLNGKTEIMGEAEDRILVSTIYALTNIRDSRAVPLLDNLLDTPLFGKAAEAAVDAAIMFNENSSIEHIIGHLKRDLQVPDYDYHEYLLLTLAYINPPGLIDILENEICSHDDDDYGGCEAATALGIIGNERALQILETRLSRLKRGSDFGGHIAMALGNNRGRSAFGAIKELFQAGENKAAMDYIPSFGGVRTACAYAIAMIEDPDLEKLCSANYFRRNKAAVPVLAWQKGGKYIKIKTDEDGDVVESSWRLANIRWGRLKEMKSFFTEPDGWCGGPENFEQLIHYEYFYRQLFAMMPEGFPKVDFRSGVPGLKKSAEEIEKWTADNLEMISWDESNRRYILAQPGK